MFILDLCTFILDMIRVIFIYLLHEQNFLGLSLKCQAELEYHDELHSSQQNHIRSLVGAGAD